MYKIVAYSKKRELWVDLYFESIKQAKRHNKYLCKFKILGEVKK